MVEGLNLDIQYYSFCSSNSIFIAVSDNEIDSIYFSIYLNSENLVSNQIYIDKFDWSYSLFINTSSFCPGNYTMKFEIWDIFHEQPPTEMLVILEVLYFVSPEFASALPPSIKVQIWTLNSFVLPEVTDKDGDFSSIQLQNSRYGATIQMHLLSMNKLLSFWFKLNIQIIWLLFWYRDFIRIQNSTLLFNPSSSDLGSVLLILLLIDAQGLTENYSLTINVIDEFSYKPPILKSTNIFYQKLGIVNISSLLYCSINHNFSVEIQESNQNVTWANYDKSSLSILISNYTQNNFGTHNLSVSIYDYWFQRSFDSSLQVNIYAHLPPAAVGVVQNVTAYQGQERIDLSIKSDIFYDKYDQFSIIISWWNNMQINANSSLNNFTNTNSASNFELQLNKNFIGLCPSDLIAVDSLSQTVTINFYIDVLKWPQKECLYWNGPKAKEWTKWANLYTLDPATGDWIIQKHYFDFWILLWFSIFTILVTLFTDYDSSAWFILLEILTFYWMLFWVFSSYSSNIHQYFKELSIIITHFNSLFFFLYGGIFVDPNTNLTNSLILNWATILIVICIFVVVYIYNKDSESNEVVSIFRVKVISKYMQWASTYIYFCTFYEIFTMKEYTSLKVLSLAFTFSFSLLLFLFSYWFEINSSHAWWVWSKFPLIMKVRSQFKFIETLKKKDYSLIVRYNLIKKLIVTLLVCLQIKFNLSLLFVTLMIQLIKYLFIILLYLIFFVV